MPTARELVESTAELVSLPDIYVRLRALLDDPDSSLAQVSDLVGHDPSLTARLLRMVNSAFFGIGTKITTVNRAVGMLGTQQIHDLILATCVTRAFSGMSSEVMNMRQFWVSSVRCGVAARLLAYKCNVLDSERLFVCGLLRDIGHLVLYQQVPELAQQALEESGGALPELTRLEQELIGCDYAQVGSELLSSWDLPESLVEAVRFHTEPDRAEDFPLESAIVHMAAIVALRLHPTAVAAGGEEVQEWPMAPAAWQLTGIGPEILDTIELDMAEQVAEAVALVVADRRAA